MKKIEKPGLGRPLLGPANILVLNVCFNFLEHILWKTQTGGGKPEQLQVIIIVYALLLIHTFKEKVGFHKIRKRPYMLNEYFLFSRTHIVDLTTN